MKGGIFMNIREYNNLNIKTNWSINKLIQSKYMNIEYISISFIKV